MRDQENERPCEGVRYTSVISVDQRFAAADAAVVLNFDRSK